MPRILANFYGNRFKPAPQGTETLPVTSPHDGKTIAHVPMSKPEQVNEIVDAASDAFVAWSQRTYKDRAQHLIKWYTLLVAHIPELTDLVVLEHGKNQAEAEASIRKGLETLEYAMSCPQFAAGSVMEVSRGVTCQDRTEAIGVVACVVPFNFPIMVPFWTLPIALACGNTVVLKPSEKVPLTMNRVAELAAQIFPPGVLNIVNGARTTVETLIAHPAVKAVTFVGTTAVARQLARQCRNMDKRCLALGGAKNHLVAAPDCNVEMTAQDVVNSFSGCAGQRCMAASVLLVIGEQSQLVERIIAKTKELQPGSGPRDIGPVIDIASRDRILGYIDESEKAGARILVDGRSWSASQPAGFWVGPTVILHHNRADRALHDEIFGPVLSIYVCKTAAEAIEIENANEYGNAACIYTTTGATAEWFTRRFSAGMLGVNIGVPVPREPFSFGGINASKFGDVDITGDGGMSFFTKRIKITAKWSIPKEQSWLS